MPISDKAKAYRSYDGRWLLLFGDGLGFGHRDVYYSPDDGATFFQLDQDQTGWGNGHMSYEDPHHNTRLELSKQKEEPYIREVTPTGPGRIYRPAEIPASYEIVLLPHVRVARYFFRLLDENVYIYVSKDKYYPDEKTRVYFGKYGSMVGLTVLSESFSKIETDRGLLEVGHNFLPAWEGLRLLPLNHDRYIFSETNGDLTIETK